jgi:hypothetical protein
MVTRDGLVKVLDFGLAKLAPAAADLGSQLATQSGGTAVPAWIICGGTTRPRCHGRGRSRRRTRRSKKD